MSYGYSQRLIERNRDADIEHIGVQLGRVCIQHGVPVTDVATAFGVSRQTIYNWFSGEVSPADGLQGDIRAFVAKLT